MRFLTWPIMRSADRVPTTDGIPRVSVLVGEAWRNVISGTTRAFLLAAVFAMVIGSLSCAQAAMAVDFIRDAVRFRDSGGAVHIIALPGGVDAAQCDALVSKSGVPASGALRAGPDITLAVTPSRKRATLESSPGFRRLLGLTGGESLPSTRGVWVDRGLAADIGLMIPGRVRLRDGTDAAVAGIFESPDDGRDPVLRGKIISPVVSPMPFDECWVEIWPESDATAVVQFLPLLRQDRGPTDDAASPQLRQFNPSAGVRFDGVATFRALPLRPITWAAGLFGLVIGIASVRVRRLELAGALHAGVAKRALALQLALEVGGWLTVAIIPTVTAILVAARWDNPANWWPAFAPGLDSVLLASVTTLVGTLLGLGLTKEKHLFRYFKNR